MDENTKITQPEIENDDVVEYEDVKHLSIGAFIGIGLAFGVAAGFSVGNLLINQMFDGDGPLGMFIGMGFCVVAGLVGGLVLGLINRAKSKK